MIRRFKMGKLLIFDDIKIWGDFIIEDVLKEVRNEKWNKIILKINNVKIGVINKIDDLDYIAVDKDKTNCFRRKYDAIFELTNTDGFEIKNKAIVIHLKR